MLISVNGKIEDSSLLKIIEDLENLVFCPKCGEILDYVNALDTEAKFFMIWCRNCDYVKEVVIKCH